MRIGKLDPARDGLQIFVWSQHEIGYCLGFDGGAENGQVIWTYNYRHFNFIPEVVFADMDQDGFLEVVLATYSHFFVYDGRTGQVKMELEAHLGRNYGLLTVTDIDHDGFPDIIMLAEQLREHVCVVKNVAGRSLKLLWDKFYEQDYPVDEKKLRTLPGSVQDWDGDGRYEILYGLYDETDGTNWRTLLVDAVSGEVRLRLENTYPLTWDMLENGRPAAFLQEISGSSVSTPQNGGGVGYLNMASDGPLAIYTFTQQGVNRIAELPDGELLLDKSWRSMPQNEWAMYMEMRRPVRCPEDGFYMVKKSDKGKGLEINCWDLQPAGSLDRKNTIQLSSDLPPGKVSGINSPSPLPPESRTERQALQILYAGLDARLYILDETGRAIGSLPAGGVSGFPLVADLGKEKVRRLLACDAQSHILCLAIGETDGVPQLEWQSPSVWMAPDSAHSRQGKGLPMAFDWDQDGGKEILVGQPPDKLAILDRYGQELWSCTLPERPAFWNFGNFTGRNKFDVFVGYSDGFYGTGCGVYTPGSGSDPIWSATFGTFASAVWDFDGDGRDDLVMRDLFWRRTLDGETGRDIYPISQWGGYHIPTIIFGVQGESEIGVLWTGGNYSLVAERLDGQQVWWLPFMSAWQPAGVADVDGDGRLEIGAGTAGQVFTWPPPMDPVAGLGRTFACLDLQTSQVKWTFDPGSRISGVVSADVDGDGLPEFIFGTGDGRLMALRGGETDDRVVFSVQLPAAVGMPVICDPAGNGHMHLLVGCADGKLYAFK